MSSEINKEKHDSGYVGRMVKNNAKPLRVPKRFAEVSARPPETSETMLKPIFNHPDIVECYQSPDVISRRGLRGYNITRKTDVEDFADDELERRFAENSFDRLGRPIGDELKSGDLIHTWAPKSHVKARKERMRRIKQRDPKKIKEEIAESIRSSGAKVKVEEDSEEQVFVKFRPAGSEEN